METLFSLQEYFSLLVYLSFLLLASFIFLPHSSTYFLGPLAQSSSSDRPEHPLLTPITSSPQATMGWDVFGTAVIMMWWGRRMKKWWEGNAAYKPRAVVDEKEIKRRKLRAKSVSDRSLEAMVATLAGTVFYGMLLLLMGAPLNSHHLTTILLALHLSLLTVWPVVYSLGIPSMYEQGIYARYRLVRLFCQFCPENALERALVYPVLGSLIGAWVGAIPIPLDWDRPWQSYPLTIAFSSIIGFILGGFASWSHSVAKEMYCEADEKIKLREKQRENKSITT
ncbi:uncharacterized protein L203_102078 [Cryptococcus depauperatus CBS 7841]|uniref:Uncharacterized protein n=1 Tax=Cryptococcus depauperatus CBS 7841 TaxID=1295531 RepID=A0A1E3IRG6_9TREE|nr:phosphatidylinositol glycan, class F [Cryptococcus depauperatus CBS 7841]